MTQLASTFIGLNLCEVDLEKHYVIEFLLFVHRLLNSWTVVVFHSISRKRVCLL